VLSHPTHRLRALFVSLLLALALPACGDDDSGDDADGTADAGTDLGGSMGEDGGTPDDDGGTPDDGGADVDGGTDDALPEWVGGVNLAGAEFGDTYPGTHFTDYIYPSNDHAQHFIDLGMEVFRVPFRWRRMQHEVYGELEESELALMKRLVDHITSQERYVILDLHDYARRSGEIIGTDALPNDTLADFWSRMAQEFGDNEYVWFGIMNEPYGIAATQWLSAANDTIAAIREAGATNAILVPGVRWTGAHSWYSGGDGSNAAVMGGVVDPGDNLIFELHQYLDPDSSGSDHYACVSETIGSERLVAVTGWLREHGYRGLLGEVAGGDNDVCEAAIVDMMDYMQANQDAWMGFTWWAAGPWWGDYPFSLAPDGEGNPAPQSAWLAPYL